MRAQDAKSGQPKPGELARKGAPCGKAATKDELTTKRTKIAKRKPLAIPGRAVGALRVQKEDMGLCGTRFCSLLTLQKCGKCGVALVHRDPPPPAPVKLTKINCISMKTLRFLQAWQRELYKRAPLRPSSNVKRPANQG